MSRPCLWQTVFSMMSQAVRFLPGLLCVGHVSGWRLAVLRLTMCAICRAFYLYERTTSCGVEKRCETQIRLIAWGLRLTGRDIYRLLADIYLAFGSYKQRHWCETYGIS
jgi:hypothetical protein